MCNNVFIKGRLGKDFDWFLQIHYHGHCLFLTNCVSRGKMSQIVISMCLKIEKHFMPLENLVEIWRKQLCVSWERRRIYTFRSFIKPAVFSIRVKPKGVRRYRLMSQIVISMCLKIEKKIMLLESFIETWKQKLYISWERRRIYMFCSCRKPAVYSVRVKPKGSVDNDWFQSFYRKCSF